MNSTAQEGIILIAKKKKEEQRIICDNFLIIEGFAFMRRQKILSTVPRSMDRIEQPEKKKRKRKKK
jgi:hypothetical protein